MPDTSGQWDSPFQRDCHHLRLGGSRGRRVDSYTVKIVGIDYNGGQGSKDFVLQITDERLKEKTGGIVQGMSGSPIIQDGKFVGALTHVFVNDPLKGYGIFIEGMLEYRQIP